MPFSNRFLSITLHAHLPYVVNHGTWPHGLEWLHEAAAETYLPLLGVLRGLERDGIRPRWNIDFSPVLLEQLSHPLFLNEFPHYLRRKIRFASEDKAFFELSNELHFAYLAERWQQQYTQTLQQFEDLSGNIVGEFRRLAEAGMIDLLTCSATHGYNPLLGTDESVRAQVRVAMATHRRHFGTAPCGIWLPECGYRPSGYWQPPVAGAGDPASYAGFYRIGLEQALAESGLQYFFVDAHLVTRSDRFLSPYGSAGFNTDNTNLNEGSAEKDLYRPYRVEASGRSLAIFPRDPRTGFQVWSGDHGYPADAAYLDFHKKRWPGGHRYWQVTGTGIDLAQKTPYQPEAAAKRASEHARHFLSVVHEALEDAGAEHDRPILSAPFDAELFGHWWSEGVVFLDHVARQLAASDSPIMSVSCADYLQGSEPAVTVRLPEGSWGAGGDNRVWLNAETEWTYRRIYTAEHQLREVCTAGDWRDGAVGERIAKQMCRELLLLESSDWQFLITTGAARDYAEKRFNEHTECFDRMMALWRSFEHERSLSAEQHEELSLAEATDGIFPEVNPEFWVRGAHASATM